MRPLLRRNNNLRGDLVDIGTASRRPFLFLCAKAVSVLQRRSVTAGQTATLTMCRCNLQIPFEQRRAGAYCRFALRE
jgi:hypothetical protein